MDLRSAELNAESRLRCSALVVARRSHLSHPSHPSHPRTCRTQFHSTRCASTTSTRRSGRGSADARCEWRTTARGREAGRSWSTTPVWASTSSRSSIARRGVCCTPGDSPRSTASGRRRLSSDSTNRTFHESLRFPWPLRPVRVVLKKRDRQNVFRDSVDDRHRPRLPVRRAVVCRAQAAGRLTSLFESGPPSSKVDVLLISEGYAAAQSRRFRADAAAARRGLFALEPFKSRRADFNVRTLEVAGAPASVEFNIFGIERYALTYDNRSLRNLAALGAL